MRSEGIAPADAALALGVETTLLVLGFTGSREQGLRTMADITSWAAEHAERARH